MPGRFSRQELTESPGADDATVVGDDELDPLYVDTIITRWERLTQQQARLTSGQSFANVKSEGRAN
jgi:hypothetical protein